MKPLHRLSSFTLSALFFVLLAFAARPAHAQVIYDNSGGSGTNVYYSLLEYGDEIILGGTERTITQFQFEYFGDFVSSSVASARIRIYRMDGPLTTGKNPFPTPGTVLYDSGPFSVQPGYQTKVFSGLSVAVPDDLTWTIQFNGLVGGIGDEAGLIFRSPPSVGDYFDDMWLKTGGVWNTFTWGGKPVANFAARITAGGITTGPSVSIRRDSGNVILEWPGTSVLQVAANPKGPFTDVASAPNKYTFDTHAGPAVQFWRLKN